MFQDQAQVLPTTALAEAFQAPALPTTAPAEAFQGQAPAQVQVLPAAAEACRGQVPAAAPAPVLHESLQAEDDNKQQIIIQLKIILSQIRKYK